jgi:hypothetical protein
MASADWKMSVLVFPQHWDAPTKRISLRALVLPRANPLEPLLPDTPPAADQPAFVDAVLTPESRFIPGLESLPDPASVHFAAAAPGLTPPGLRALYEALALRFPIAPAGELPAPEPRRANTRILKYLPTSYRSAFAFGAPHTPRAVIDDSFRCALRHPPPSVPPLSPSPGLRWGQVIASVLSQPRLAERLGLVYRLELEMPAAIPIDRGGWLYVTFAAGTTYASLVPPQPHVALFAARIPPLNPARSRPIFAPVLFPIPAPALPYDEYLLEAATWDDGFAKIVHCAQPLHDDLLDDSQSPGAPVQDAGIQLGWDDEQLVIWFSRQGEADPQAEARNAPLGVNGYRVDVRRAGDASWTSLSRVEGDLKLGSFEEHFLGEHALRIAPMQLHGLRKGDFWMPSYFARWNGKSLVVGDDFSRAMTAGGGQASAWTPVGIGDVPLRYGNTYEFRVRLADLSGGGPDIAQDPVQPADAPVASCQFRRFVPPKSVRIEAITPLDAETPQTTYRVRRPVLGYPALVYAGVADAEALLLADVPLAKAEKREVGLPDPDVAALEIEVAVLDPAVGEEPGYRTLYTATRAFPADAASTLDVEVAYQDIEDVAKLPPPPAEGPLPLPTARDLRLRLTALCRPDEALDYFGSQEARRGPPIFIQARANSRDERGLFANEPAVNQLHAHMLEPDASQTRHLLAAQAADGRQEEAPRDLAQRLAARLGLEARGLLFIGRPDRRTVFGCSRAINHLLSPEHAAITFASKSELTNQWVSVVSLTLARDWTWDGLADASFEVSRTLRRLPGENSETAVVGSVEVRRGIHHVARGSADQSETRIVFFDAVDPKPLTGEHPGELEVTYTVRPRWKSAPGSADDPFSATLLLPIAAPPTQTPKLASAGIGLSSYRRSADYSSSQPRRRALWLEMTEPVANPGDALFARVLAYAPDPMLTAGEPAKPPSPVEPPLPIPPEPIRSIVPGQAKDAAGLDAMQKLIPSDSPLHFYVPLPPGLSPDSLELLGFFVYELRVGHAEGWSTARARFGPSLRATGIQHPAPSLVCDAGRSRSAITVSASYATPISDGRNLLPQPPNTEIWGLLYAQVVQIDGEDRRNVLIGRKRAKPLPQPTDWRETAETVGMAQWEQQEIDPALAALAIPRDAPLSVLAVELLPEHDRLPDPLGADLGRIRILRASPLVPVPQVCL